MKRFYMVLAVIAVLGIGAMWLSATKNNTRAATPIAPGDTIATPGWLAGSDSAPVEVEEYADFQCPACGRYAILTMPDVMERLVKAGKVRWRFRDFPLQGHQNTIPAHEAAACVGEQGGFWQMHDQLYFNQRDWEFVGNPAKKIRGYAEKVGVDMAKYDACLKAHRYLGGIMASAKQGAARGVNSTPTFIIGGHLVSGALTYDDMKAAIEKATPAKKK
ncbi:MAG: DsbA family protein [Gemmatimonadetes bacterium]|nr:DsbA family protein [Gemmatimonadota bacterium]